MKSVVAAVILASSILLAQAKTCTPFNAASCPRTYDSCCKYICAEAQVPFRVCNSKDETGQFASCSKCPAPTPKPTITVSHITTKCKTTTKKPTTTKKTTSKTTSICQNFSAPGGHCPSVPNKCCAYICGEAQVPFNVCQSTDGSGQFAQCSKCPTTTVKATPTASSCTPFSAPAGKCPTKHNSCCAYLCGEAQVPFNVCQPTDGSGSFAQCTKCPLTPTPTTTKPNPATCTPRSARNGQCPSKYDPCCAYKCAEAQVPFEVCQPTDGSGQFAVCTKCPKA